MPRNPKRKLSPSPTQSIEALKPSFEPYPDLPFPTSEQCQAVRDALLAHHGFPQEFAKYRRSTDSLDEGGDARETVLDGLMSTLLSQNTTESNSRRAFESLKTAFPTWDQILVADAKLVEDAIRCGGLAVTKAARIKSILRALKEKRGEICLEYLRSLSVDEIKAELSMFKGIGPKTVACVLMFQLQRDDFPVDTHVFRITRDIGWIPIKANREQAYIHLNNRIPNHIKFDLNCLLVTHGRLCHRCSVRRGNQNTGDGSQASCPLTQYSQYKGGLDPTLALHFIISADPIPLLKKWKLVLQHKVLVPGS
ncbi:putative DNA glycosylase At3g47830 [Curcuma longa]|uniref:putative DNA glycosylase At3g47830 n=1 Tax=Curcuma longa TaxID=136217 RepID=UPI003D9DCB0D